jgi:hypothetical protein
VKSPGSLTLRQWVVVLYGAIGLGLLPWSLFLLDSLQPHHTTERWDVAWSGFDTGLAVSFLLTALAAHRRSIWVGPLAAATATLLVVDAWFDVVLESHGTEERAAVLMAVFAELPMAAICLWVAVRAERFVKGAIEPLHLAAPGERPPERDLVRVLEISSDREPAGEPRDADASP